MNVLACAQSSLEPLQEPAPRSVQRRGHFWIAKGSPEYAAWTEYARARNLTLIEYRSAVEGTIGFWRRNRFPAELISRDHNG
jgi:hypothetical protein